MTIKIVTHNETFHCDEVLGCGILKLIYPDAVIIRTRDVSIIESCELCDIVLDVGKIYDPNTNRFDHHQESFNDSFSDNYTTPLSSCGLIWKHYGHRVLEAHPKFNVFEKYTEEIYNNIYKSIIHPVDCNDNGISNTYVNMVYFPVELSNIVSSFNETHNETSQYDNFIETMTMCQKIFMNYMNKSINKYVEYYEYHDIFLEAFNNRIKPYYIVLNDPQNIHQFLKKYDKEQTIKFIIAKTNDCYKLWTINKTGGKKFEILMKLISEKQAQKLKIGNDLIFIHKVCFTGACKTLESSIKIIDESFRISSPYRIQEYLNIIKSINKCDIFMVANLTLVCTIGYSIGYSTGYLIAHL